MSRRFLTVADVADVLNVSPRQVYSLLKSGEMRGIQVGGRGIWRIGEDDLEAYVDEMYRRASATPEGGEAGADVDRTAETPS